MLSVCRLEGDVFLGGEMTELCWEQWKVEGNAFSLEGDVFWGEMNRSFFKTVWETVISWQEVSQISRWFQPRQDLEAGHRRKLSTEEVGPLCDRVVVIDGWWFLMQSQEVDIQNLGKNWTYQLKEARSAAEMHQNSGRCESKCVRCQESCKFGGRVVVAVDLLIFFTWFMTYDIYSIMGCFGMFFGGSLGVSVAPDPQNWTFVLMEEMLHQLRLKTSNIVRYVCIYCHAVFLPSTVFHLHLAMETGDFGVEWIIQKKKQYTMFSLHFLRLHHPWDVIINLLFLSWILLALNNIFHPCRLEKAKLKDEMQ